MVVRASRRDGFGHVRRTLSLAEALRVDGLTTMFALEGDPGIARRAVPSTWPTTELGDQPDRYEWVPSLIHTIGARAAVVDSYEASADTLAMLVDTGAYVAAMDDHADRQLPVHLVINGALDAAALPYERAPFTTFLLGPQFALLRAEFVEPPIVRPPRSECRVLIMLGGSDPFHLTRRILDWLLIDAPAMPLDVVAGPLFDAADVESFEALINTRPTIAGVHRAPTAVRSLMATADIAICGGGQTTYELAAAGLPAIGILVADNQEANLRGFEAAGSLVRAGAAGDADLRSNLKGCLELLQGDPLRRAAMARCGRALVDGAGARRVAGALVSALRSAA